MVRAEKKYGSHKIDARRRQCGCHWKADFGTSGWRLSGEVTRFPPCGEAGSIVAAIVAAENGRGRLLTILRCDKRPYGANPTAPSL
jgi:hypothetical protein